MQEYHYIGGAIARLYLFSDDIRFLSQEEASQVLEEIQKAFCSTDEPKWWFERWWESFQNRGTTAKLIDSWSKVPIICPIPDEKVWLIPLGETDTYVYESSPEVIARILEASPIFEYAVVNKTLDWILIENYQQIFIGLGEPIEEKLSSLDPQP